MTKLVTKLAALTIVLLLLQIVFHAAVPGRGVPAAVAKIETLLTEGTDVIFFGDSTLYRGAHDEGATPTLPERVARLLPNRRFGTVAHDAYSPILYRDFVRYLSTRSDRPKAIIVPINLRAFSVERDLRPEYQFRRESYYLRHADPLARALFHPLASWGFIKLRPIANERFASAPVYEGDTYLGTVSELSPAPGTELNQANLGAFIDLCYRYSLTDEHRQVRAIGELIRFAAGADITPFFYITPVDIERGTAAYGPEFAEIVRRNARFLSAYIEKEGEMVLNLIDDLGANHFAFDALAPASLPDAYLRDTGKEKVAASIAELLSGGTE